MSKYSSSLDLPLYYWWNKKGPFIYTKYVMSTPFYDFDRNQFNFIDNINFELNEILDVCKKIITKTVLQRFLSLNPAAVMPLMNTENQRTIIKELEEDMIPTLEIVPGDDIYAQCVLNSIWNQRVLRNYANVMYVPSTLSKERLSNGLILTRTLVHAHYYRLIGPMGEIFDTTHYMQYNNRQVSMVAEQKIFYLYYLQYKTFAIYDNGNSDIGYLENIINKYGMTKIIKIKDDHIVFLYKDDSQYQKIKEILIIIDEYFKYKNIVIE